MSENTSPTPPTPTPKTRRPRSTINRQHLDELARARDVAAAAVDPANAVALAAVEMPPTLPTQINTLATQIEDAISVLTGNRVAKQELTVEESLARDALITLIHPIQTAAKRKYTGDQETLRHAYFIGENLARETLNEVHAAASAIHSRLVPAAGATAPVDVLPGIKTAQITALANAIGTYATQNHAQNQQGISNTGALNTVEADLATLAGLRHAVQLAADQAWPWRTPGVAATRKAFHLPTDKPL